MKNKEIKHINPPNPPSTEIYKLLRTILIDAEKYHNLGNLKIECNLLESIANNVDEYVMKQTKENNPKRISIEEEFKDYLSEKIMDKTSPLYYLDIIEMMEAFKPKQVKTLPKSKDRNSFSKKDMIEAFDGGCNRGFDEGQDQSHSNHSTPEFDEWIDGYINEHKL